MCRRWIQASLRDADSELNIIPAMNRRAKLAGRYAAVSGGSDNIWRLEGRRATRTPPRRQARYSMFMLRPRCGASAGLGRNNSVESRVMRVESKTKR